MTKEDILHLCNLGEQTTVQFKERITPDNKYDVGCEMVALSNTLGGLLIIGINDKTGCLNPLSFAETQETIEQLGNLASENVVPSILITTENVSFEDGTIVVATIKQGSNRP
jgi:predicted HTH transcriptional regulator